MQVSEVARTGFMTGITSLQRRDESQPYSQTNVTIKLFFFLPNEVFDGSGLERHLQTSNIIPYAAAPVPNSYGEFLDWTVAHEIWHVIDLQARLNHLLNGTHGENGDLDRILQDPVLLARQFQGIHVSELLGWKDSAERYMQADELAPPLRVTRGATTYKNMQGRFVVTYADGRYTFERQLERAGYLPESMQRLDDLAPLLQSGKYPTLYSLFNGDEERFADYGAWFFYSRLVGEGERFTQMDPQLDAYYTSRWQVALAGCGRSQPHQDAPAAWDQQGG
jgi:hypothetical protein